jgi:hypothetical protein
MAQDQKAFFSLGRGHRLEDWIVKLEHTETALRNDSTMRWDWRQLRFVVPEAIELLDTPFRKQRAGLEGEGCSFDNSFVNGALLINDLLSSRCVLAAIMKVSAIRQTRVESVQRERGPETDERSVMDHRCLRSIVRSEVSRISYLSGVGAPMCVQN